MCEASDSSARSCGGKTSGRVRYVRDGNGPHPCGLGGAQAVGRILEHQAGRGGHAEPARCEQEEIRSRLHRCHVVTRAQRIEGAEQRMPLEPRFHPGRLTARGERDFESHRPCFGQPLRDARQERLGFAAAPMLAADPVAPAIASDGPAAPATEVRVGVESALSAERMLPILESERRSMLGVDLPPDFEQRRFAVDNQTIEIEDDCGEGHRLL